VTYFTRLLALFVFLPFSAFAVDVQVSQFTEDTGFDPAVRGGQIVYVAKVINGSADTATNTLLVFPIPATTTFDSVDDGRCVHDNTVPPGQVNCALGDLVGNGLGGPTTTIKFTILTSAATGSTVNVSTTITADGDTDTAQVGGNNNFEAQTTTIDDGADLVTTINDTGAIIIAGANVTYTVSIDNNGPNDAAVTTVTNTLPADVTFVSASGAGWSCSNAGQDVTCTRPSIANGATAPDITIVGKVTGKVTGAAIGVTGTITDSVTVSSTTRDPNPNNNTQTEDTLVEAGADLSIVKSVNPDPVTGSATATFTFQPRNNGPFDVVDAVVADTFPAGFTLLTASGAGGWTCGIAGQTVTCNLASFIVGNTNNITVTATAPASGTFSNTATISNTSGMPDPTPGNNSSTISNIDIVPDGADLAITKSKTPNPVAQGSPLVSTIGITNNGPQDAAGPLTVTETLAGETYVGFSGANWSCAAPVGVPTTEIITCTYTAAPLSAGSSTPDLIINTIATNAGNLVNTAVVASATLDGVPGNNTTPVGGNSTAQIADLAITKAATTLNANTVLELAENVVTYTLTVTNNGPNDLTDPVGGGIENAIVVTDTVPKYVSGVVGAVPNTTAVAMTSANPDFTCTTGATVTCRLNDGLTFINGRTEIFTFTATRPFASGDHLNTASVRSAVLGDDVPGNNTSNQTTITVAAPADVADVEVTAKTATPDTVNAGVNTTYVVSLRNNGPAEALNVTLQDIFAATLPAGKTFTVISAVASNGASCDAFGTGPGGARALDCDFGTLARNATRTVTLVIRPDWDIANLGWTMDNTATVSTTTDQGANLGADFQTETLTVNPAQIDLLVNNDEETGFHQIGYTPTPGAFPATTDNIIVYKEVITNRGPSLATGVNLAFDMTPKAGKTLTFLCDNTVANTCDVGTSTCNNINANVTGGATLNLACPQVDMAANTTLTRYLFFRVDTSPEGTGDTHTTLATVSANEDDTVAANDTEAEDTVVRVLVDVGVTKDPSQATVSVFEPFDWNLVISSNGPGDAPFTDLTDALPAGMELTGPPIPSAGSCTGLIGETSFECNFGTLVNGDTRTVTVPVRLTVYPAGGTITNTAFVTTFGIDRDPTNDSDPGVVNVVGSSISGTVFDDINDNGSNDGAGDAGIPAVTVHLTGTDLYGNTVDITVNTLANGTYSFDDLAPSDAAGYTITETQPAGFVDGLDNAGGATGSNLIANSRVTDVINTINLPVNTDLTGYDFAEVTATESIAGVVWVDTNNDGVRDGAETRRIADTVITLTGTDINGDPINVSTTTAADGSYSFAVRPSNPAGYTLTETQPANWADGLESLGSGGGTIANDVFSGMVVVANDNFVDYDFGERGVSISGSVYVDQNTDGINDPAEPGIPSVTITLTGTDIDGNPINIVTTTGADGRYSFEGLPMPNGTGYTVTETQPPGIADGIDTVGSLGGSTAVNDVISGITFPVVGGSAIDYNFGEGSPITPARISGSVWLDSNHNRSDDEGGSQAGWTVELIESRADPLNNTSSNINVVATVITDASGNYVFENLSPGIYEIRFKHPQGGFIYGTPLSSFAGTDTANGTIHNINVIAGADIPNQDLPIDPSGVVYDAVTRAPVAGATVTLAGPAGFNPATDLVGGTANISQVTGADGFYQFLLFTTAPAGTYTLTVTSPPSYLPGVAASIPACTNTPTIAAAPDPALVQNSAFAPALANPIHDPATCPVTSAGFAGGSGTTQYFLSFSINPTLPSGNVVNNHIPLDPILGGAIVVTKTTPKTNVVRGELVPYTITATNTLASVLGDITLQDQIPPGFKYVENSATIDGIKTEPNVAGRGLDWPGLSFSAGEVKTFQMILIVGAGVNEGKYVNQAWALNSTVNARVSNIATAAVRVIPDPLFDCSDLIGKVFDDKNINGYQDEGEPGLAGVRVVTPRGLLITTDDYGRFHIACADVPNELHGSNFLMKLDTRTLPSGYRVTTENPRVVRLTRGKLVKLNFGAALHKIIRIDIDASAFSDDGEQLTSVTSTQLDEIIDILQQQPSQVRLSYNLSGSEGKADARTRMDVFTEQLTKLWQLCDCDNYALTVEHEIITQGGDTGVWSTKGRVSP